MTNTPGKVYLVGAGPGDPGLLTLRGKDLLARANVVVYDLLVNEVLLRHAPEAEKIFVGKRPDHHTLTQDDIHRVLLEQARRVPCVVRLKGGDPFVFGRGGEEALFLAENGIPYEVVPGVTAGIAAPAYAGIPVTHRGKTLSVTFLSGHLDPQSDAGAPDLETLHLNGTLVLYMGAKRVGQYAAELIRLGRSPDTPAAAIQSGTLNTQKTIIATLETIHQRCEDEKLESPVVVIIGEVVDLRPTLAWFEDRPLFGRRVAVTRTRERSAALINRLRELGADVFEFPTVQIDRIDEPLPFKSPGDFDWIVFTSVNGVDMLFEHLAEHQCDARDLHGVELCAIGDKTNEALRDRFIRVDVAPPRHDPETVLPLLEKKNGSLDGQKVLFPRADIAPSTLPRAFRDAGAQVTEMRSYRARVPTDAEALASALVAYRPDYVSFTSASAARNFHAILGADRVQAVAQHAVFAAIGPIARDAATNLDMPVTLEPEIHRVEHLVDAIVEHARR